MSCVFSLTAFKFPLTVSSTRRTMLGLRLFTEGLFTFPLTVSSTRRTMLGLCLFTEGLYISPHGVEYKTYYAWAVSLH